MPTMQLLSRSINLVFPTYTQCIVGGFLRLAILISRACIEVVSGLERGMVLSRNDYSDLRCSDGVGLLGL